MRNRLVLALAGVLCLAAVPGISGYSKKKNVEEGRQFQQPLTSDEKILQALNRLTFGPRPGDVEAVKAMGLKKWIDRQLHPERIAENPLLDGEAEDAGQPGDVGERTGAQLPDAADGAGRWSTGSFPSLPIPTAG